MNVDIFETLGPDRVARLLTDTLKGGFDVALGTRNYGDMIMGSYAGTTIYIFITTARKGTLSFTVSKDLSRNATDEELIRVAKAVANAVMFQGTGQQPPPPRSYAPPPPQQNTKTCSDTLKEAGIATRKDFRTWAVKNHPDKGGDTTKFQEVSNCADQLGARRRKRKTRRATKRRGKTLKRK